MMLDKKGNFQSTPSIIFIFICITFISLISSCKKHDIDDDYLEPVNISNNTGRSENPSIATDSKGTVHLVWNDDTPGNEDILYAFKPKDENWSTPVNISNNSRSSRSPSIAIDKNDVIHLTWQDCSPDGYWRIFYSQMSIDNNWSVPETITGEYSYVVPKLAIDNTGNVHFTWAYGGYQSGIRYAMRTNEGFWIHQMTIIERAFNYMPSIAVDNQRTVHVIWSKTIDDYSSTDIFYSTKQESGLWSSYENISNTGTAFGRSSIVANNQGNIYCIWNDWSHPDSTSWLFYRMRRQDGTWTVSIQPNTQSKIQFEIVMAKGPDDELYIPGEGHHEVDDKHYLLYITKQVGVDWSDTIICGVQWDSTGFWPEDIVCSNDRKLYFVGGRVVGYPNLNNEDIFCIEHKIQER